MQQGKAHQTIGNNIKQRQTKTTTSLAMIQNARYPRIELYAKSVTMTSSNYFITTKQYPFNNSKQITFSSLSRSVSRIEDAPLHLDDSSMPKYMDMKALLPLHTLRSKVFHLSSGIIQYRIAKINVVQLEISVTQRRRRSYYAMYRR